MKPTAIALSILLLSATGAMAKPRLGVVSYWGGDTKNYWKIPDGSLALINPDSGIFKADGQSEKLAADLDIYNDVFRRAQSHDIALYAYVPTGYFNHTCNTYGKCQTWERIEAQVRAYFKAMPRLTGIFFDETAPANWSCDAYVAEYARLRTIVHTYRPEAKIIYNLGMPDECAVTAAQAGEILVLFENSGQTYMQQSDKIDHATQAARAKGVGVWHMVNGVGIAAGMQQVVAAAAAHDPDFLYITDISGDWQAGYNTYGDLPAYWNAEVKAIADLPQNQEK